MSSLSPTPSSSPLSRSPASVLPPDARERALGIDPLAAAAALAASGAHPAGGAHPWVPSTARGLVGRVVQTIGLRIVGGDLPVGTHLPNASDWCGELEVSRTVLREATKVLVSKGLLESRPKTGTRVRPADNWNVLDPDVLAWQLAAAPRDRFVRELFELRRVAEPAVAALAAIRASADDIARLENAYRDMAACGDDPRRFIEPDMRFHRTVLTAIDNGMLRALGGVIETALTLSLYMSLESPRDQRQSLPLHEAVMIAIRDRDPEGARRAMQGLIDDAEEDVRRTLGREDAAPLETTETPA